MTPSNHTAAVRSQRRPRRGLTLVELMASIAVSLLMVVAMVEFFKQIGAKVSIGRAHIEMSARLRNVTNRLQDDLDGLTLPALPWPKPSSGFGYFEVGEGVVHDGSYLLTGNNIYGDHDDFIAMTIRSNDKPFVGRVRNWVIDRNTPNPDGHTTIESKLAEVIWWLHLDDFNGNGTFDIAEGETFTLRRRIFLIRPDLNPNALALPPVNPPTVNPVVTNDLQLLAFRNDNDLSVRFAPATNTLSTNTLSSLTRRENRVAHRPGSTPADFPNLLQPAALPQQVGLYQGEDVMTGSCIAFNLKVFDPGVPIRYNAANDEALLPGDPGYSVPANNTIIGNGAFVDLGINTTLGLGLNTNLAPFTGNPAAKSRLPQFVYDTWSFDYEHDLIDQNTNGVFDEGTDGLNSGGTVAIDEVEERETSPPYPLPLRGVEISIRIIDRGTRQVRQATVRKDLAPE